MLVEISIHRLHDENDYTIVLNPYDGDFYYATKRGEEIIPSEFKAGSVEPSMTSLIPGIKLSQEQYLEKKNTMNVICRIEMGEMLLRLELLHS